MPAKPHRLLLDRVSGYADEAAAYMRRRRHIRKPFVRVYYPGGRSSAFPADAEQGQALFLAASRLIDLAPPRRARQARTGSTTNEQSDR
jgi:hypothetical protein